MSTSELRALLGDSAATADQLLAEVLGDRGRLPVVFPGLPRRFGRQAVGGGRRTFAAGQAATRPGALASGPTASGPTIDLDAFRRCDVTAAWLLLAAAATDAEVRDLFAHGDIEERAMVLRSLHLLPLGPTTRHLFDEVQRSNVVLHLEALVCDGDLLARARAAATCAPETADKLLLKFAFVDLPLARTIGVEGCANAGLSRMLQDLATEREAAGRAVWRDTWRMLGRAPCPGAVARLIGGLEHGDDGVRLAAADGLLALPPQDRAAADVARYAAERLPREPRPELQLRLEQLSAAPG